MKRFFKIIGIAAAVLVALVAVSLLVLRQIFPPERIQKIVLDELRARLHREVRLSDARIGMTGIWIRGLEVSEEPDFKSGTMAKADQLRVQPSLSALLSRRIEIAEILLQGWECRILHRRDGTWNFESKTTAQPADEPPPSTAAPGSLERSWAISKVRFEHGSVRYLDEGSSTAVSLKSIRFTAQHVRPQGKIPLEASADYAAKDFAGSFQLKANLDLGGLDAAKMSAKWTSLKLKHQGLSIETSGSLENLASPALILEFSIPRQRLKPLDATRWPSQLPLLIPLHGRAEASKRGDLIDLRQAKVVWNSLKVEVGGKVLLKDPGSPDLHLHLKTGLFSLSELAGLLPVAQKVGPKGQGDIDLRIDGRADAPALAGEATLKGVSVHYQGQSLSGLDASAKFSPEKVTADTKGVWNRGQFELHADLRNYQKAPDLRLSGRLSELDLGALMQLQSTPTAAKPNTRPTETPNTARPREAGSNALRTTGKVTIDKITHPNFSAEKSAFDWDLKDANAPALVTGTAKFNIGPGKYDDLKNLSKGGMVEAIVLPLRILQTVGHVAGFAVLPNFDRGTFKSITGDYTFQKGLMTIRESHMDSSSAYVVATGKANFANDSIDMYLSTRLNKHVPGLSGPIGIKIGCSVSAPCPKLDSGSILKQPEVKKAVNQLLQNIFK